MAAEKLTRSSPVPLLSVRDLSVSFGPAVALSGVDLVVGQGELVALAGENGAGKTTLLRCIAGELVPGSGEVELLGQPVAGDRAAVERAGVAVIRQDLALCDNLDVASNLLLGREKSWLLASDIRVHAEARQLLRQLGIPLTDTAQSVATLSGGQRQLLAVARAMRDSPRILFLDEPTAALGVFEAAEVEDLILRLRAGGATGVLVTHDLDQMFRLADRILVLRAGRLVADLDSEDAHPDDVVALMSGQAVESSARGQLSRLQRLADRLAFADRSSSLSLILSTLGAALRAERLAVHRLHGDVLRCAASFGLPAPLRDSWSALPLGEAGGPVGAAASRVKVVVDEDVASATSWEAHRQLAADAGVASSWAVPVVGARGVVGVITVLGSSLGRPSRDELDLVGLYAGYAASAIERDELFGEVTARNRLLETIRDVLETLAGPVAVDDGVVEALRALTAGLAAEEVALLLAPAGLSPQGRGAVGPESKKAAPSAAALEAATAVLGRPFGQHRVTRPEGVALVTTFAAPGAVGALVARWQGDVPPPPAEELLADAAHSFHLALEREETAQAQQEAAALRRSRQLQRGFLSRLSHELRTPLTAIRGYASSLLQPDVTWDGESTERFLSRVVAESARLGRLVDDLLDFSAIESGVMRLQRDWCNLELVLEAAIACLAPEHATGVGVCCEPALPVVWADHDRLEQVFVNLMENAFRHNPSGTRVQVVAVAGDSSSVEITVSDDGTGMPPELVRAPFDLDVHSSVPTAGTGLGLSIAQAIVDAHGGSIELDHRQPGDPTAGTSFTIRLPTESGRPDERSPDERSPDERSGGEGLAAPLTRRG